MENKAINIGGYATTVIDNNDDVAEKSITLFKEVSRSWNRNFQSMCGILRINNVRNGFISYDFSDYQLQYELNSTQYTTSNLPSGLDIKIYRDGKLEKSESVMVNNDFNQILGNAVIYTFNYEYSIDIEIAFQFGYGLRRYQVGRTPEECHCCCSKCSGGDPIYEHSSLYDYIDLKVTYNQAGVGEDRFHRINSEFNEEESEPGTYSYKREYDLGDINFRMVDVGINENKAMEMSFYNSKWETEENHQIGPCKRHRIIGTVLRESVEEVVDNTQGELPEEPYTNVVVTKENIKNSDIFKRVSFNNEQLLNLNTYEIINFYEKEKQANATLKIYLTKINNVVKLIVEYLIKLPNVNGIGNDRLRFKSKIDIGLNFKLK